MAIPGAVMSEPKSHKPLSPKSSKVSQDSDRPYEEILEYHKFMCEEGLEELEIEEADFKLKIRRKSARDKSKGHASAKPKEPGAKIPEAPLGETVNSPLLGIFYRSPSPSADPFVAEGKTMEKNSILCVVEAMKVMNEIRAEKRCKVLNILVENGKQVTPGQPLFVIESL